MKLYFMKGKGNEGRLTGGCFKMSEQSDRHRKWLEGLWKLDSKKKFCAWLGLNEFKISLIKFT